MTTALEAFLGRLGSLGAYHVLVYVLLACNFFPVAFNHMLMLFYGFEPPHTCKMPEGWAWHRNESVPIVITNGQERFHQCKMYKDPEDHALGNKDCVYGWQYEVVPPEWPIVAEWNLVCDRAHLVRAVEILYLVGCLVGSVLFGSLADRFGRRCLMFLCLMGQTGVGIAVFFIRRFFLFATLRFFLGIFIQGLEIATFIMVMELFRPKYRTLAGSSCFMFYACGMMFLALLCYSIQYWRYIQLAVSLPSLIGIIYIFLIPESLRWLIVNMKPSDVTTALKKCSRFTSIPLEKNVTDSVEDLVKEVQTERQMSYDVRDIFKSSILRRYLLLFCFCWLSAYLTHTSLAHFIPPLNKNQYLNFFLLGVIELLSHLSTFIVLNRFGRRKPLFLLFIGGGILSIASVLVDHLAKKHSDNVQKVSLVLAVFGKICITSCASGLYIFTAEIFPTVLRSVGLGLCVSWKTIGILLTPVINLLGSHTLKAIPVILVGAISMVAAFVILMLPETISQPLPDTLAEAEDLGKHKTVSSLIDKSIGPSTGGKLTPTAENPLTPPLKRAKIEQKTEGGTEMVEIVDDDKDGEESKEEDDDSSGSRRNSRIVRFLGIDILDETIQQKTRKKSTSDSLGSQERRVRFCNVVHDIEELMEAMTMQNATATAGSETESQVTAKADGGTTDKGIKPKEHLTVQATESNSISSEAALGAARPVSGILKKSSNEEGGRKIVKSPHPVRKNSPTSSDASKSIPNAPVLVSAKILDIEPVSSSLLRINDTKLETDENSRDKSGGEDDDEQLAIVVGLSPDLLRLKRRQSPPDDGLGTPSSSSSGEPTPEGSRRFLKSDDSACKSDCEDSAEEQPTANNNVGEGGDCTHDSDINPKEKQRKLGVYKMDGCNQCSEHVLSALQLNNGGLNIARDSSPSHT